MAVPEARQHFFFLLYIFVLHLTKRILHKNNLNSVSKLFHRYKIANGPSHLSNEKGLSSC